MLPREYNEMLTDAGFVAVVAVRRSRHWRVKVQRYDGSVTTVSFPSTPSDRRGLRNKAAQLKHIAKE